MRLLGSELLLLISPQTHLCSPLKSSLLHSTHRNLADHWANWLPGLSVFGHAISCIRHRNFPLSLELNVHLLGGPLSWWPHNVPLFVNTLLWAT